MRHLQAVCLGLGRDGCKRCTQARGERRYLGVDAVHVCGLGYCWQVGMLAFVAMEKPRVVLVGLLWFWLVRGVHKVFSVNADWVLETGIRKIGCFCNMALPSGVRRQGSSDI